MTKFAQIIVHQLPRTMEGVYTRLVSLRNKPFQLVPQRSLSLSGGR